MPTPSIHDEDTKQSAQEEERANIEAMTQEEKIEYYGDILGELGSKIENRIDDPELQNRVFRAVLVLTWPFSFKDS